ncbi:MAG: hypothetical protein ACI9T9_002775 [Oleiphilaceae bacterium]
METNLSSKEIKIAIGKHSTGRIIHIKEADNGKRCDCVCLECGSPLIAVQGKSGKRRWHFSHSVDSNCSGMSVLHALAQEILFSMSGKGHIMLPPLFVHKRESLLNGDYFERKDNIREKPFFLSSVQLERRVGSHINDAVCYDENGNILLVEVFVTNKKSEDDIKSFQKQGIACIEIDLSNIPWDTSIEDITSILINEIDNKKFLQNIEEAHLIAKFKNERDSANQEILSCLNINDSWVCRRLSDGFETSFGGSYDFKDHKLKSHIIKKFKDLRIKMIQGECRQVTETIWASKVLVNEQSEVIVFCGLSFDLIDELVSENISGDRPVLGIVSHPINKNGTIKSNYRKWYNVNKWHSKIKNEAYSEFRSAITASQTDIPFVMTRAKNNDKHALINALGIPLKHYSNAFSNAWNAEEFVWKAAVAKYKIQAFRNQKFPPDNICRCNFLCRLLNFDGEYYLERLHETAV